MKEVIIQDLTELMKMLKSTEFGAFRRLGIRAVAVQLHLEKETVKSTELRTNDSILHHDNAPAHKTLSVQLFLDQKLNTEREHTYYFPYLAPNDLWLFIKIKSVLEGRRYQDTEDIQIKI